MRPHGARIRGLAVLTSLAAALLAGALGAGPALAAAGMSANPTTVAPGGTTTLTGSAFTANQSVVLVQNPYYNALPAAPGHPRPSQIKFVAVTNEANALAQDLQSAHAGVDAAEDFQTDNLPVLSAAKHYHVHNLPGRRHVTAGVGVRRCPGGWLGCSGGRARRPLVDAPDV